MQPHSTTRVPRVQLTCLCCGDSFEKLPCELKRDRGKFCSRECHYAYRRTQTVERFWKNVAKSPDPDGCWMWTASRHIAGYGSFYADGKNISAHRFSYELHYGKLPPKIFACHDCDRNYPPGDITYRACVRPDHLFAGTAADNQADMVKKGRSTFGDRNGMRKHPERRARGDRSGARKYPERLSHGDAHWTRRDPERGKNNAPPPSRKLTPEQVQQIRQRYIPRKVSFATLGREYGVTRSAIHAIIEGRNWRS